MNGSRLHASISVWVLLSWIFLVLPLMSLAVELPLLFSARVMMVHAARAAGQSAWVECLDYPEYQRSGTVRAVNAACPPAEARALFADYLEDQSVDLARTAAVTSVGLSGTQNDLLTLEACVDHRPIFIGVISTVPSRRVCVSENVRLRMRQDP